MQIFLSMASKKEVESFLQELISKIDVFDILFLDDRGKNQQTILDLEIIPVKRKDIIKSLKPENYSGGPLDEKMHGILPMWIFGKLVKGVEIYIKVSMGSFNSSVICISFHKAEHNINYPYKK